MWNPIATAPKDGTPFLALNSDHEVWVARWTKEPVSRLTFRTNKLREQSVHEVIRLPDGREARVEDKEKRREYWASEWTLWTKGYEFSPTQWAPLPEPSV